MQTYLLEYGVLLVPPWHFPGSVEGLPLNRSTSFLEALTANFGKITRYSR